MPTIWVCLIRDYLEQALRGLLQKQLCSRCSFNPWGLKYKAARTQGPRSNGNIISPRAVFLYNKMLPEELSIACTWNLDESQQGMIITQTSKYKESETKHWDVINTHSPIVILLMHHSLDWCGIGFFSSFSEGGLWLFFIFKLLFAGFNITSI